MSVKYRSKKKNVSGALFTLPSLHENFFREGRKTWGLTYHSFWYSRRGRKATGHDVGGSKGVHVG